MPGTPQDDEHAHEGERQLREEEPRFAEGKGLELTEGNVAAQTQHEPADAQGNGDRWGDDGQDAGGALAHVRGPLSESHTDTCEGCIVRFTVDAS